MTRANLNFTYRVKGELKVLYHYHNGDQYPTGIRDHYHLLEWLEKGEFTPKGFTKWLADNYKKTQRVRSSNKATGISIEYNEPTKVPVKPILQGHTIIGDLTDYTYVFNRDMYGTPTEHTIQVYEWDSQIFDGNVKKFVEWLKKQK
jgi:hypothetical protein